MGGVPSTGRADRRAKGDGMPSPGKFAFGLALCGFALLLCCDLRGASAQPPVPGSLTAQSEIYSAPLELINDKPYVSVMLNGRGPFRFLLDTGTGGQALVTPALAEELHLSVVGHAHLTDPSGLGEQRSEVTWIE